MAEYTETFICPECDESFSCSWDFGDDVECPHCETVLRTDYETNSDDNIVGPWIIGKHNG